MSFERRRPDFSLDDLQCSLTSPAVSTAFVSFHSCLIATLELLLSPWCAKSISAWQLKRANVLTIESGH